MKNIHQLAQLDWDELISVYDRLNSELTSLGGGFDSEESADAVLQGLEEVVRAIALHQARNLKEVSRKLNIALTLLDEAGDPLVRDVIASIASDLTGYR